MGKDAPANLRCTKSSRNFGRRRAGSAHETKSDFRKRLHETTSDFPEKTRPSPHEIKSD